MSSDIIILLRRPTKRGRIYPRYDAESDILTMESAIPSPWTYGVDIDGNIVFDLNEDGLLANLDLHVGRRLWRGEIKRAWRDDAPPHDIEFTKATIDMKNFSGRLGVHTNRQKNEVEIELGQEDESESAIALSERCLAFVHDNRLVAILARL